MILKTEYLVIIDKDTSAGFFSICDTTTRFNEFITKHSELKARNSKISFGAFSCDYAVRKGQVKGKEQTFFHLSIAHEATEDSLLFYKILTKELKKILHSDKFIVETLRDDLSFYYCKQAYSQIHIIENLMRKFITYFMITNVGKDWITESTPEQIKFALGKSKRKEYFDALQQLDFAHLGDLLFKSYHHENAADLYSFISSLKERKDLDIHQLKSYIPQSNWDKYFKDKVKCDDQYLITRWKRLYELRNIVAHTSFLSEDKFEEIKTLVTDVKVKLEEAFHNIDSINLDEIDRDALSEHIASNIDENVGNYIREWNALEKQLRILVPESENAKSIYEILNYLGKNKLIDSDALEKIDSMRLIKAKLVNNIEPSEENVINYNKQLVEINNALTSTWKDEVVAALLALGGEATLSEIYGFVEKNTLRNLPASWTSTVRKAIYLHSSDTDIFSHKEDLFEQLGKGKWRLRA